MSELADFRKQINELDHKLIPLLGARLNICRQVAAYKRASGTPVKQTARADEVRERAVTLGAEHNLDPDFMRALYTMIIDEARRVEYTIVDDQDTI